MKLLWLVAAWVIVPLNATSITYGDLGNDGGFNGTIIGGLGGWCVTGSTSTSCGPATQRWIAVPIQPVANLPVNTVELPLNYISGTDGAIVKLMNSVGGVPGTTALATWDVGLPAVTNYPAQTAQMVTLTAPGGLTLTGGTQYWLVAEGAASSTLDIWWLNNTGAPGGITSLNGGGTWTALTPQPPFNGSLPAYQINGTASSGCQGTSPSVCYSAPALISGTFTYTSNFTGLSGTGDIYVPITDPDADDTITVTNGSDSEEACNIPIGRFNVGCSVITNPSEIQSLWPAGSVPTDEGAFADPVALVAIPENGLASLTVTITSPDAPAEGPVLADGSVIDPPLPGPGVPEPGTLVLLAGGLALVTPGRFNRIRRT